MKKNKMLIAVLSVMLLSGCGNADSTDNSADEQIISETVTATASETVSETENTETTVTKSESATESVTETEETIFETEISSETEETVSEAETTAEAVTETEAEETTATEANFSGESVCKLIYNDKCVYLSEITDVKGFFGTPPSPEMSAPSCLGEGTDIIYTYSDFIVSTFEPDGGTPYVVSVISTGDSISNPKGLYVGMSESDAIAILGGDSAVDSGVLISIITDGEKVCEIDYMGV